MADDLRQPAVGKIVQLTSSASNIPDTAIADVEQYRGLVAERNSYRALLVEAVPLLMCLIIEAKKRGLHFPAGEEFLTRPEILALSRPDVKSLEVNDAEKG